MIDDSNYEDDLPAMKPRTCPECRGTCIDRAGDPCDSCWGEGVLT